MAPDSAGCKCKRTQVLCVSPVFGYDDRCMEMEHVPESDGPEKEAPLCLRCLKPVDPSAHYCPHCGEATGQLTPYIPYVSIPWETRIWGQMWRQVWSRDVPIAGRLFRLFVIVWFVPILLIGLIFQRRRKSERPDHPDTTETDRHDEPEV